MCGIAVLICILFDYGTVFLPYIPYFGSQLSRLEALHNSWLRCITRDTVGRPDSISTKDLMEKTHQLPLASWLKRGD